MSEMFKQLWELLHTSVYHPHMNGLVEQFNGTLKQLLRTYVAENDWDWLQGLPLLLFGVKDLPQTHTGYSPFALLFGQQFRGVLDVLHED